jgi:hypothetical protein
MPRPRISVIDDEAAIRGLLYARAGADTTYARMVVAKDRYVANETADVPARER